MFDGILPVAPEAPIETDNLRGLTMPNAPANRFERHPKLTIAVVLLLLFGIIELAAYFAVRVPGFYEEYNRKVSGYTVFQNNPKHPLKTQKSNPDDPDVVVDDNGFISAEPLLLEKPAGTVRIFLMGGSAAFGADQNSNYRDIYEYPFGIYTFPDSIAGQLQAYLEELQPGTRFEVVTAAAFTRAYHQSVLYYLEAVSRFSPDWVISMDGFNDVTHLVSGTPYGDRATELQYYIDLQNTASCTTSGLPNTYCLLQGIHGRLMIELTRGQRRELPAYASDFDLDRYTRAHYLERKPRFEASAARFVQILKHELGIMRADGVNFMFVLQPMLHRQDWNKDLSERETSFARGVAPPLYSVRDSSELTEPEEFIDAILLLKFFFDDYLSPLLAREVAEAGYHYLDMNQALQKVPASTEFYTDYCHMTVEGNRLIASGIGDTILAATPYTKD
jgi:lysophospholipase L1-like esterase